MANKIIHYLKLEEKFEKIMQIGSIASLAHWDSAVMLQAGSANTRQKEVAALGSLIHEMSTSSEIADLITKANEDIESLNEWQKSNLGLIKKSYDQATCISAEMAHELSIATSESEFAWRKCRLENDFKTMAPYLDRVFKIVSDIAQIKSKKFTKPAYDILLDGFDPDRESSEITSVYDVLKKALPDLIHKIIHKQSSEKIINFSEKFDNKLQKQIGLKIAKKMGFDFNRGRLDKSTHPFCIGGKNDVRITTRYDEKNFLSGLFGVIHEAGHGLYQQALPENYIWQAVGGPKGMGFHESQSLIMEMQATTTIEFCDFLAKLLKDEFSLKGAEYSCKNLYRIITRVKPNFIRVDADEVTYPLHVILRFEIEQDIVAGKIKAADLPEIWNNKMKEYLGIVPDNYANGCLQDIHWPSGLIGYFPSYTNGAIIASMLMKKIKENHDVDFEVSQGDFSSINNYLNKNLRQFGSLKSSKDLLKVSTGYDKIQPDIFINYLQGKYLA